MKKLPQKLQEIVEEHYHGRLEELVFAAREYSKELYKLQGKFEEKKLLVPQPHHLKNYLSEEERNELRVLSEGLLGSNYDKNLADVVQKSVVYRKGNDIYGIPYAVKAKDVLPALAGGSLARIVGRFLPPPYGLIVTVLGAGAAELRELKQREVKNPFQQLADALSRKANEYGNERRMREVESAEDNPKEERRGYWGKSGK